MPQNGFARTFETIARVAPPVVIALLLCASGATGAHEDEVSTQIGEYRVTLNSVKPSAFDDNAPLGIGEEATPDVEVHTFTQAETHDGIDYVSQEFVDAPVGNVIGIGDLIYWHLDCTPSQDLQMIVDVLDIDPPFPPKELTDFLKSAQATGTKGSIISASSALLPLIGQLVNGNDRFRQWASNGFSIPDHHDTFNISLANPGPGAFGEPVGLDEGDYEFGFTPRYREIEKNCTSKNLIETATEIASTEAAIKKVVDQLIGQPTRRGKDAVEEPKPAPKGILERLYRATDHFPFRIDATVGPSDTLTLQLPPELSGLISDRFYLLGAAANAIRRGTVVMIDASATCSADAAEVLAALRPPSGPPDGLAILQANVCEDLFPPT